MAARWKSAAWRGLVPVLALAGLLQSSSAEAGRNTQINVPVTNVRSSHGTVFVALYERGGWLVPGRFLAYRRIKAHRGTTVAHFQGVPEGQYGLAVFHDENNNGKVDTNVLGLPKEGFGFSRKSPLRKPRWPEVAFDVRPRAHSPVHLRY